MFKRFLKKISFLGPVLFAALSYPLVTHAFSVTGIVEDVLFFVLNIFQIIGGVLFIWAGQFTSVMLNFNYNILQANTLITDGWTIVRDLANLGFVLVIIVIAIATILRYKAYGAGQLLTKLIAAAIIVNFSLTIAGVFLDFSHSLTRFFFGPVQGFGDGSGIGVARTLSAAFSPQRFFADPDIPEITEQGSVLNDFSQITGETLMKIASFVFAIIFTFTAAFTLFALAFLLFLRYIYLSFLLVLAPIIWLFWVVPSFKKYFSEWWGAFVKWTIFAPASAFFLYLSLVSIQTIAGEDALQSTSVFFADGALAAVMKHGVQLLVLTGFFFGSLVAAQKLGVAGASGAVGLAKKWQKGATKWVGQKVKLGAKRAKDLAVSKAVGSDRGQKVARGLQSFGRRWSKDNLPKDAGTLTKFGYWMGRSASKPVRSAGFATSRAKARAEQDLSKSLQTKLTGLSAEDIGRLFDMTSSEDQQAKILSHLGEKGLLQDALKSIGKPIETYVTEGMQKAFSRLGMQKEYKSFTLTAGMDEKAASHKRDYERAREEGDTVKMKKVEREYLRTMETFVAGLKRADLSKLPANDVFGKDEALGNTKEGTQLLRTGLAHAIAFNAPGYFSSILPNASAKGVVNIQQAIEGNGDVAKFIEREIQSLRGASTDEDKKLLEQYRDERENLFKARNNIIARYRNVGHVERERDEPAGEAAPAGGGGGAAGGTTGSSAT